MVDPSLVALLSDLVRIDSINPAFSGGRSNESVIAGRVAREMEQIGLAVERREPEPGRVSVIGRLTGSGGGRSLMLYSHLDTVGVEGMEAPFEPVVRNGRLYGRGAYDMKAGTVACLAAARELVEREVPLRGDVLVIAVADEEEASRGIADVLAEHRPDAAIVTEPTELALCLAHKGFCWIEVRTEGRAAHGSRFEEGVDANLHMGRVLGRLGELEELLRGSDPHPLVGPPSLHVPIIEGGTGPSTYAGSCRIEIERRTVPGETEDHALREVRSIVQQLENEDPAFRAATRLILARPTFEVRPDSGIVHTVEHAAGKVRGMAPDRIGHAFWMDASLLAEAGVETVVIGHAGGGAHSLDEWVDLESVQQLKEILVHSAAAYCG